MTCHYKTCLVEQVDRTRACSQLRGGGGSNASPEPPLGTAMECQMAIFTLRGAHVNCAIMAMLYTHSIRNQQGRTRWWCLKCVIVYLARDIPPFVMYCVYGQSGSSLLIESTAPRLNHMSSFPNTEIKCICAHHKCYMVINYKSIYDT